MVPSFMLENWKFISNGSGAGHHGCLPRVVIFPLYSDTPSNRQALPL
jgi:hypothetical protein